MKKLLLALALLNCLSVTAQEKDVTTFLGIPVDGLKSEMIQKLKAKGFTPSLYDENSLDGEFNGTNVSVIPVTNNNKVYRIAVMDSSFSNETDIKIRFNRLCSQFENNARYITLIGQSFDIPEDEDLSYNITVKNKRYEAAFYQKANNTEGLSYEDVLLKSHHKPVWFMIDNQYGKYRIIMFYDNILNQSNGEDL